MSCLYNIFFRTNKVYALSCEPCETEYPTNECAICLDLLNFSNINYILWSYISFILLIKLVRIQYDLSCMSYTIYYGQRKRRKNGDIIDGGILIH